MAFMLLKRELCGELGLSLVHLASPLVRRVPRTRLGVHYQAAVTGRLVLGAYRVDCTASAHFTGQTLTRYLSDRYQDEATSETATRRSCSQCGHVLLVVHTSGYVCDDR